ncbi:MAG: N6-L-threonylcarbamoyladenine synthase [Candidatus Azotimanducaceae bacterium]|jgi:N6-L-threonylcarbamoyladenine synthase
MHILSIETSCDETAVSLVRASGEFPEATYEILGDALHSQVDIHAEYGGVYPTMAKREHILRIMPLAEDALTQAELLTESTEEIPQEIQEKLHEILYREEGLADALIAFAERHERPQIDLIAVTAGPGLEPALWVGVNFAKALAYLMNIPVVSVNHMEGHILASVFDVEKDDALSDISFPAISLLISGGHTELIHMKKWGHYEKVGQTRDDAVGEAFDKVARMLGLPYPGGPEISKLAAIARFADLPPYAELPRPMLNSKDLDFSFSGLKTAVLYAIDGKELSETNKQSIARDFEDAVAEVLTKKTYTAIDTHNAKTLIVGGGVSANQYIRQMFNKHFLEHAPETTVYFPNPGLSTDNAIMIALAGHAKVKSALSPSGSQLIKADGNRSLEGE